MIVPPADRATGGRHRRWPAARFYWAVLDTTLLCERSIRRHARNRQLGFLFEADLPLPIDEVHAVYRRLDPGRCLACGVRRAEIESIAGDGAITLAPQGLPAFVEADIDPAALNALVGLAEPDSVGQWRRRWVAAVVVLVLVAAAVVLAGFDRRAEAVEKEATDLETRCQSFYEHVIGPGSGSAQPRALRLAAELRRLRQTRIGPTLNLEDPDAAVALAGLLERWPVRAGRVEPVEAGSLRAEAISVTPVALIVRATVPDSAAAQALADTLRDLPGWQLGPLQFRRSGDSVSVLLRFEPASKQGGP